MKSLKRIRDRTHRCYELAFKVMMEELGAEKFALVHGRTGTYGIQHAWIETGDGRIYDTTLDTYTPAEQYKGIAERRYTRVEAARFSLSSDYPSGPWHMAIFGDASMPIGTFMLHDNSAYNAAGQFLGKFADSKSAADAICAQAGKQGRIAQRRLHRMRTRWRRRPGENSEGK